MKKPIFYVCFALFFVNAHAQKGYVKFRGSVTILGSTRGIMNGMEDAGYNAKGVSNWLFGGSTDYPTKFKAPSLYIEGGLYVKENRSVSVVAGLEDAGDVDGQSYSGGGAHLNHKGYVFSPRLNFHQHAAVLGFGPALMIYNYSDATNFSGPKGTKAFPGASFSAERLFRGKKQFSVGVFGSLNLYTSATIQIISSSATLAAGQKTKINPSNLQAGLFLRYGK